MIFDTVIETDRLILRCLDLTDAEHLFRLRSDTEYAEMFGWTPYKCIEQAYERIERCRNDNLCYVFSVVPKITGFAVGGVCLWNIDHETKKAEIGYDLEKDYRKKGYAFEACEKVLGYALNNIGMKTIVAFPRVINHPSIVLLQKLGFKQNGITTSILETGEESEHYNFLYSMVDSL